MILDYAVNSTDSIFERRSLKSYVEERFGKITPEVSALIMYQMFTFPKDKKMKEYVNRAMENKGKEITDFKYIKYFLAVANSTMKMVSLAPRVFKIKDTEQDNNNYLEE